MLHAAVAAPRARMHVIAALLLVLVAVRAAPADYTDMQKWAGVLAQSFLAHSDNASHAHTQLAAFRELVIRKARRPIPSLASYTHGWAAA